MCREPEICKFFVLAGILLIVYWIIPLFWFNKISFNLAVFTNYWYEEGINLANLLIAFFLANVFWYNLEKKKTTNLLLSSLHIIRTLISLILNKSEYNPEYISHSILYHCARIQNMIDDLQREEYIKEYERIARIINESKWTAEALQTNRIGPNNIKSHDYKRLIKTMVDIEEVIKTLSGKSFL